MSPTPTIDARESTAIWPARADDLWHVFELPKQLPGGFCFSGLPVGMTMVDWFNAPRDRGVTRQDIIFWLQGKPYIRQGSRYLVITNAGDAFVLPDHATGVAACL